MRKTKVRSNSNPLIVAPIRMTVVTLVSEGLRSRPQILLPSNLLRRTVSHYEHSLAVVPQFQIDELILVMRQLLSENEQHGCQSSELRPLI